MADTDHRRDLVRSLLRFEVDADLLLITDLANIRYLTGFSGSNAVLLLGSGADDDLIGTDGRYRDQVLEQAPDLKCVIDRDTLSAILDVAPAGRLGIEATLPVGALATIRTELQYWQKTPDGTTFFSYCGAGRAGWPRVDFPWAAS